MVYTMAKKRGLSVSEYRDSSHISRKYKKEYCENIDGRLGFICTTTILIKSTLHVDHVDGNPHNNTQSNCQTLCASCHAHKTKTNGDNNTPGRKTRPHVGVTLDVFLLE